jgi:hypothetical protein
MKLSKLFEDLSNKLQGKADDHEVDMAITDLRAIADMAGKLAEHLSQENPTELEGWVQSKITKAADYIQSVYKNHMYSDYDCGCGSMARGLSESAASIKKADLVSKLQALKAVTPQVSDGDIQDLTFVANKSDIMKIWKAMERLGVQDYFDPPTDDSAYSGKGTWVINAQEALDSGLINEANSTCCGRCGRKHVKGTSCPKPYLTGKRHCRNR